MTPINFSGAMGHAQKVARAGIRGGLAPGCAFFVPDDGDGVLLDDGGADFSPPRTAGEDDTGGRGSHRESSPLF